MAASNRVIFLLRTYGGTAVRVAVLVAAAVVDPSNATVVAIRAAIEALTKAKVLGQTLSQPVSVTTTSAAGAYEDDQDKADLTFACADGTYHTWRIPAPADAIFQADKQTVDLANANVITLKNYIIANCVSKTGAAITALVRGKRIRLNAGRRV